MDVEAAQPRPRPEYARLAFWAAAVGTLALLNYQARFAHGGKKVALTGVYSLSTFANGTTFYALSLGVVLLICIHRFDLLALRQPRSRGRAAGLAVAVVGAILVWENLVSRLPLPESPGQEQGLANVHWEPKHAAAFAANFVLFAVIAPVVEELTFRGAGQSLLAFLGRWPSIALVGVAFGVAHGLVEALIVLVPFGMALAWLRDRTNSVVPGMFVHGLFNAAALIAIVFR